MTRMQRATTTSGAQPACAACKHQRKKCHGGCVLAPYFPAERAREFQAVHKVFGVSNVTKMVRSAGASEEDRRKAVDSLVWEACCRQRDPILGPYAEYRRVFDELKIYKSQEISHANMVISQLPPHQRTLAYKSLSGLVGWNSASAHVSSTANGISGHNGVISGGINVSNNGLSYFHENGSVVVDQSPFSYASSYVQSPEKTRHEKNNVDSHVVQGVLQGQHSLNGFNHQQYYLSGLSGQLINQVNSKTIESTIWEGGS